jgi:hypothetical protein
MIEKDFVPYEETFELDKLEFGEDCFAWYVSETYGMEIGRVIKDDLINDAVLAPTYSQAFRFFRDKHNINAQIAFCEYSVSSENSWKFTFDNPTNVLIWNGKFNTYEEAELECLKVLIEMVKTK